MRVLVVGASGLIGGAIVALLKKQGHEVVAASRSKSEHTVDLMDPASIRRLYQTVGPIDAVVSAAGDARWKPFAELTDEDWDYSLRHKLRGQIDLVRHGVETVREGGVFVLTSGVLAEVAMPGTSTFSTVNAGVQAFARTAALDLPRKLRIQVVSPPWVAETMKKLGMEPKDAPDAAKVAETYARALTASPSGQTLKV